MNRSIKLRLTADKRLRYASPKYPLATFLSAETLGEMLTSGKRKYGDNL